MKAKRYDSSSFLFLLCTLSLNFFWYLNAQLMSSGSATVFFIVQ
jgi:hypothetical protein